MKIIGKDDAIKLGLKTYFTGIPCSNKHIEPRLVRNSECLGCKRDGAECHKNENSAYYFARQVLSRLESSFIQSKKEELTTENCERMLGYSSKDFQDHIARQFRAGMSWDHRDTFHIDHIIPVAQFKANGVTDISIINHLSNLTPLPPRENLWKGGVFVSQADFDNYMSKFDAVAQTPWSEYKAARERGEIQIIKPTHISRAEKRAAEAKAAHEERERQYRRMEMESYKKHLLNLNLEYGVTDIDGIHRVFKTYGSLCGMGLIRLGLRTNQFGRHEIPYVLKDRSDLHDELTNYNSMYQSDSRFLKEKYNSELPFATIGDDINFYDLIARFGWQVVEKFLKHCRENRINELSATFEDVRAFTDWEAPISEDDIEIPEDAYGMYVIDKIVHHPFYPEVESIANELIERHDVDTEFYQVVYDRVSTMGKERTEESILIDFGILEPELVITAEMNQAKEIADHLGIDNFEDVHKLINQQGVERAVDILERLHDNGKIVDGKYTPIKWF